MSQDEETTLLFEDYLENRLSEADKLAFNLRLEQDEQFATDFNIYKEISEQLSHEFSNERKVFIENLKQTSAEHFKKPITLDKEVKEEIENKKEQGGKLIRFNPWKLSIAASIVLIVGFFLFQNSGSASISDFTFNESISLTMRSANDATYKNAETQFNEGDYAKAINSFDALLKEDPKNVEIQFYKALSHDAILQFDEADALFGKIYTGNSAYKYKAQFYRAISKWKQDQLDKVKTLLRTIPEDADEYEKAQKLLKKL